MIVIIIFLLFSISLCLENICFNFAFELRSLVFAVFATGLIGFLSLGGNCPKSANALKQFIFRVCAKIIFCRDYNQANCVRESSSLVRRGIKITSIDVAYFAAIILTVISFVSKSPNINAFHNVFVACGMMMVYFVIRFANSDEILLQSKIIYSIVGIGFIVAVIGLIQFAMGKPVVSTFGRTSYLGCFLAMNIPLAFSLVLATTESKGLSKVKCRKVEGEKEIPLAPFMKGGIIITKVQI